ncbi:hypothetical protein CHS0354_001942 [Potamilus streckersoni]|uniref:3-ketoacyl-[acyl-carrier-protein] reductase beta subunit n=1 Tax=Potamilus streckersoni TaxID=2493646 RepID=A0AAE0T6E4_9BIVA|nr:hypothetical protein CHS0354_001942 [Potamilus streckersoni]
MNVVNTEYMDRFTLNGKTAIITGGAAGIGLAFSEGYLEAGASVMVCDIRTTPELEDLQKRYSDHLCFTLCDVTKTPDIDRAIAETRKTFGGIDILLNNAAIFDMAPLTESHEQMYDKIFSAVAKVMIEQKTHGKIINMASQAGRRGEALVSHYCASKAAVISYTQSAALALAPYHINVNAVSPGVVDTPMWKEVDALFARYEGLKPGEKKAAVGRQVPLGYMGKPIDIVGAAIFLASSASDYITAQTVNVDGGNVMS